MFDLSLAETSLTLVVALLLIGPEELPGVIRGMRNFSRKSQQVFKQFTNTIMEIEEVGGLKNEVRKLNEDIKKIIDLDGILQETYDISDIMPEIEKTRDLRNKEVMGKINKDEIYSYFRPQHVDENENTSILQHVNTTSTAP